MEKQLVGALQSCPDQHGAREVFPHFPLGLLQGSDLEEQVQAWCCQGFSTEGVN